MHRYAARTAALGLLACALTFTACAPGRSVVRGNWPDGRIMTPVRHSRVVVPVPVAARANQSPTDEFLPAEPADAGLTAADFNRMGVLQAIHFAFDRDRVQRSQIDIVEANAQWLRGHATARIIIEGHCDERGTREYNQALGQRRANAARDFLISLGIDPARIETVSYGEELPADPAHNEAAWAENRRADFIIVATRP